MVELSTRISNMSHNNVMLLDFAFNESRTYEYKKKGNPKPQLHVDLLNERPGLERIIYSSVFDLGDK